VQLTDWLVDALHTKPCHAAEGLIGDWVGADLENALSVQTASRYRKYGEARRFEEEIGIA